MTALVDLTLDQCARGDWRHVHNVLLEARKRLAAEGFGRQAWMDAALDIAEGHATKQLPEDASMLYDTRESKMDGGTR